MATMTKTKSNNKALERQLARVFAELVRALTECSDEVQHAVYEMVEIVNDPASDPEDAEMALATIHEALFPTHHNGNLGADLFDLADEEFTGDSEELASAIAELDAEESAFSDRVQKLMHVRSMTQAELAAAAGVGQPAISMMLARDSRPQKRTVAKIAAALGVTTEDLWPTS